MNAERIQKIIIQNGNIIKKYVLAVGNEINLVDDYQQEISTVKVKEAIPNLNKIDFFRYQKLVVLKNRGRLDPKDIDEYIALGGYAALNKVLDEMTPEEIINEIKASGLRGRGGAGFPTASEWEMCRKATGNGKYVVCNIKLPIK